MNYTIEEINHIIYNNRTIKGVVNNFLPKLNLFDLNLLMEIGNQLRYVDKFINKDYNIFIDKEKLDLNLPDIKLYPHQLKNIKVSSRIFSDSELKLLDEKKIPNHIIEEYDISSLSQIKDLKTLEILGVTTHPILTKLIGDGISDGLIIPLYKNNELINTVFRKTNDSVKLKYGITVPSLDLWGDEILRNDEIWLCEGLFDMMAIRNQKLKCISASSCSLNDYHYFKILKNKPSRINIFVDNDISGYRSALKSKRLFGLNGIMCKIYHSKKAKDAAEHFFELMLDWNDVEEINITTEMISRDDKEVDFLKYLENRNF